MDKRKFFDIAKEYPWILNLENDPRQIRDIHIRRMDETLMLMKCRRREGYEHLYAEVFISARFGNEATLWNFGTNGKSVLYALTPVFWENITHLILEVVSQSGKDIAIYKLPKGETIKELMDRCYA